MTTNIIDPGIHLASIPANYTGPGTLAAACRQSGGVVNRVNGVFTSNGNATQINVGFRPLKIHVYNITDGLIWDWQYGMAAANSLKTTIASPAIAVDTNSQLLAADGGAGNWTVTIGATANGTSKSLAFEIEG